MRRMLGIVTTTVGLLVGAAPLGHAEVSVNRGAVRGSETTYADCCRYEMWEGPLTLTGAWPGGGSRFVGTIRLGQAYGSYDGYPPLTTSWTWKVNASVSGESADGRHLSGYCVYDEPPVRAADCFTSLDGGPLLFHHLKLITEVYDGQIDSGDDHSTIHTKVVGTYTVGS